MKRVAALALVGAFFLVSCQNQKKEEATPFITTLDTKEVMGHVVDTGAQLLWKYQGWVDTAEGTTSRAPKNEEEWLAAESGAAIVAEAANLLMLPQRQRDQGDWIAFAKDLNDKAMKAREAVISKDEQRMFDAGGELYQTCLNCHEKYLLPFLDPHTGEPLPGSPLAGKPTGLDEKGAPKIKADSK